MGCQTQSTVSRSRSLWVIVFTFISCAHPPTNILHSATWTQFTSWWSFWLAKQEIAALSAVEMETSMHVKKTGTIDNNCKPTLNYQFSMVTISVAYLCQCKPGSIQLNLTVFLRKCHHTKTFKIRSSNVLQCNYTGTYFSDIYCDVFT